MKELSKKTGLTPSFLSQVERALASPSVGSLEKIAHALNARVSHFFDDNEHKEVIFVRKGRDKRYVHKDKKAVCETLASGFLNINVQPQIFTMVPGSELAMENSQDIERRKFSRVEDNIFLLAALKANHTDEFKVFTRDISGGRK